MGRKIYQVFTTAAVAVAVTLAVLLVGIRLIGFRPYAVLSPSMTPRYQPGDLVYVQSRQPDEIRVGQVLTFLADRDTVVTHRVDEIDRENRLIYTKGDANRFRDTAPVPFENVIGTVAFSLPKLGYVSAFLTGRSGSYALIAIGAFLLLILVLPALWKKE